MLIWRNRPTRKLIRKIIIDITKSMWQNRRDKIDMTKSMWQNQCDHYFPYRFNQLPIYPHQLKYLIKYLTFHGKRDINKSNLSSSIYVKQQWDCVYHNYNSVDYIAYVYVECNMETNFSALINNPYISAHVKYDIPLTDPLFLPKKEQKM